MCGCIANDDFAARDAHSVGGNGTCNAACRCSGSAHAPDTQSSTNGMGKQKFLRARAATCAIRPAGRSLGMRLAIWIHISTSKHKLANCDWRAAAQIPHMADISHYARTVCPLRKIKTKQSPACVFHLHRAATCAIRPAGRSLGMRFATWIHISTSKHKLAMRLLRPLQA